MSEVQPTAQDTQQANAPAPTTPADDTAAASSSLSGWMSWARQTTATLVEKAQTIDTTQVKSRATDALGKAQGRAFDILGKAQGKAANLMDKAQHMNANQMRHYMSGHIVRYQDEENGFDLDLTYVTDNIVAMGLPSEGIESMFMNPIDEVVRFFVVKHGVSHIKVFNLCDERSYTYDKFNNQVAEFRIKDNGVCGVRVIFQFCTSAVSWLSKDPSNLVAIHCKGHGGRTALMVCCLLLFTRVVQTADEALKLFMTKRTNSEEYSPTTVMNASQLRYVRYFAQALQQGVASAVPIPTIFINEIEIGPIVGGAYPSVLITSNGETLAHIRDPDCYVGEEEGIVLQLQSIPVTGDFCITIQEMGILYDSDMLSAHFHTHFLTNGATRLVRDECVIVGAATTTIPATAAAATTATTVPEGENQDSENGAETERTAAVKAANHALKRFSDAFLLELRWSTSRVLAPLPPRQQKVEELQKQPPAQQQQQSQQAPPQQAQQQTPPQEPAVQNAPPKTSGLPAVQTATAQPAQSNTTNTTTTAAAPPITTSIKEQPTTTTPTQKTNAAPQAKQPEVAAPQPQAQPSTAPSEPTSAPPALVSVPFASAPAPAPAPVLKDSSNNNSSTKTGDDSLSAFAATTSSSPFDLPATTTTTTTTTTSATPATTTAATTTAATTTPTNDDDPLNSTSFEGWGDDVGLDLDLSGIDLSGANGADNAADLAMEDIDALVGDVLGNWVDKE